MRVHRRSWHVVLLLVVGLGVVSCGGSTASQPDWFRQWLRGIPCHAPCWYGITPGVTTGAEAIAILRTLPFVTNVGEFPADSQQLVGWSFGPNSGDGPGNQGGLAYQTTDRKVVTNIELRLRDRLRLNDLIAAYGPPSHVRAADHWSDDLPPEPGNPVRFEVALVYLPYGIFVDYHDTPPLPRLDADFPLNGWVRVFVPNAASLATIHENLADYVPWAGFQDFQFYLCQRRTPDYIPKGC